MGSDYFGESKMGGLRMWNRLVHERGGARHALRREDLPGRVDTGR